MLFRAYQCSQLTLAGPFALGHGREVIGFGRELLGHWTPLASSFPSSCVGSKSARQPSLASNQPPGNLSDTHSGEVGLK